MITSTLLQSLGYTLKQSHSIMRRLKELYCPTKSIRVRCNYVRNGAICDLIMFVDAIDTKVAIEALSGYIAYLPKEASMNKWANILKTITEWKAKQDEEGRLF